MGARASDTVRDIERIRSGLDAKLVELERRLPPLVQAGRKVAAIAVGGGVGTAALSFALKRRKKKKEPSKPAAPAPVVVNVFPKGAMAVAVAGIAVWAGVRIYESMQKDGDAAEEAGPAVVKPLRDETGS